LGDGGCASRHVQLVDVVGLMPLNLAEVETAGRALERK
jgi:hypothetical protein